MVRCEGLDYHPIKGTLSCKEEASLQVDGRWYCWMHETEHGRQLTREDLSEEDRELLDRRREFAEAMELEELLEEDEADLL